MVDIDTTCFDHGGADIAFSGQEMLFRGAFQRTGICLIYLTDPYPYRLSCRL